MPIAAACWYWERSANRSSDSFRLSSAPMSHVTVSSRAVSWPALACTAVIAGASLIALCFPQLQFNRLNTTTNSRASHAANWLWLDVVEVESDGGAVTLSGFVMIDFYTTGLAYSFVLRALWLGGAYSLTTIGALALVGSVLGWRDPALRRAIITFGAVVYGFMALTVVFPVTGRVRTPIQPLLFPLAAYGVTKLRPQTGWGRLLTANALAVSALVVAWVFESQLPGPNSIRRPTRCCLSN